jgi:outer membrane protein OmpA-like peptidoglycan-associated protein
MKTRVAFLAMLFAFCLTFHANAQQPKELVPGYYVVVGAYAPTRENVAKNYTEVLIRRGLEASYGFNSTRNHYYVYLHYYDNLKSSLTDMVKTRKEAEEFAQAWVRVIPGDIVASLSPKPAVAKSQQKEKAVEKAAEPVVKTQVAVVKAEEKIVPASSTETIKSPAMQKTEPVREKSVSEPVMYASAKADGIEVTENPPIKQYEKITLANTEVFLSLFNSTNNRIVEGQVTVVDLEREKPMKQVKGNEYITLPNPNTKSGKLKLVCEAFGYRKVEHELNYLIPLADTAKNYVDLMGTTFVINFDLVRYHVGDLATLFNVYFYNDASVMLPESRQELNRLLQMLNENPHYRIRLHGHTNGNYHGKILAIGPEKNFFSIDGSVNSVGSAKDLSYNRAETIREYLESNGIDQSRIEVKAWGGKRPVYDKHSVNAKKNVRVEVEILAD